MSDALLRGLPRPLPAFVRRFGTDAKCRANLVRALWPDGFRCSGCGHAEAYSHQKRLIKACRACGKQHSILAGTMVEQTTRSPPARAASRPWNCSGSRLSAATAPPSGTAWRRSFGHRIDRLLTVDGRGCTRFAAP